MFQGFSQALLVTALVLLPICTQALQDVQLLKSTRVGKTRYYDLHVTLGKGSPDCYKRNVILINGLFQPAIEVNANDTLVVNVFNDLPPDYPQVTNGISIHWHGLSMWRKAVWYDGVAYVTQCPIQPGDNFTYSFLVDESPGTYFWHDHANANRADGLQGPLIVRPQEPAPASPYDPIDGERVLFLSDWYHTEGNALAMSLNRPMDRAFVTKDSGSYSYAGNPQSILINGQGNFRDCDIKKLIDGDNGYAQPSCNVTRLKVPKMMKTGKGCRHAVVDVDPGKRYLLRIINAGMTAYMTVCFEGHVVTIVNSDSTPIDTLDVKCVDLNLGERYEVLLNTPGKKKITTPRNYWITVHTQYMSAGPAGYGILRYSNTPKAQELPPTPTPQPGVKPWDMYQYNLITTHEGVIGYLDNYQYFAYWSQFIHNGSYGSGVLYGKPQRTVVFNTTAPIMKETGQARWTMNNVVSEAPPPCTPLQKDLLEDPLWLERHAVLNSSNASVTTHNREVVGIQRGDGRAGTNVYTETIAPPLIPAVGIFVVKVEMNDIVDVIINNRPTADGLGPNGRRTEQHPFHLHGHKFWIFGQGQGVYNHTRDEINLNYYNPALRDTLTLFADSWIYIRFVANNPGIWPLHCHVLWHHFMGQQIFFLEAPELIPPPPKVMARCPTNCTYNLAPFSKSFFKEAYGKTKYDRPHT